MYGSRLKPPLEKKLHLEQQAVSEVGRSLATRDGSAAPLGPSLGRPLAPLVNPRILPRNFPSLGAENRRISWYWNCSNRAALCRQISNPRLGFSIRRLAACSISTIMIRVGRPPCRSTRKRLFMTGIAGDTFVRSGSVCPAACSYSPHGREDRDGDNGLSVCRCPHKGRQAGHRGLFRGMPQLSITFEQMVEHFCQGERPRVNEDISACRVPALCCV